MTTKRYSITIIFILFITLIPFENLFAQSSKVTGTISDAASDEPLVGANVILIGTGLGSSTDPYGNYNITGIKPGIYNIRVTYIGYKSVEFEIDLSSNQTLTKDFSLQFESMVGETVIVTAQAQGQIEAINQQLTSNTIKNVVSADRIQELPDVNAAESIGRLSGVSILRDGGEGNKVVIRGLAPQYNTVLLNGIEIPSTDRVDRSVDLNMVASNMLSGIEVTKALTPDLDANSIGGVINLKLKEAPEGFRFDVRTQGGYNGLNSEFKNYKLAGDVSSRFVDNAIGAMLNFNFESVDRSSERLAGTYGVIAKEARIQTNNIILRDVNENRLRGGFGLILDYKFNNGKIFFNTIFNRSTRDVKERDDIYNAQENIHGYNITQSNGFITDVFNNSIHGEYDFDFLNAEFGAAYIETNRKEPDRRSYYFVEEGGLEEGAVGYSRFSGISGIIPYAKNNLSNTYWYDLDFRTREAKENDLSTFLNLKFPYTIGSYISGNLKFGGKYRYKTRNNDENQLEGFLNQGGGELRRDLIEGYLPGIIVRDFSNPFGLISTENLFDNNFDYSLLGGDYHINWMPRLDYLNRAMNGLLNSDIPNDNSNTDPLWVGSNDEYAYDHELWDKYYAGYIMTELNIGQSLMILPGIRYEYVNSEYSAKQSYGVQAFEDPNFSDTTSQRSNKYWFPQIHVRYKATDWFDIRLAYTETITRPDYRSISPFAFISADRDNLIFGNPDLNPSPATNYDIFLSFYSNVVGLFTVGGFYKEIEGLVYEKNWTTLNGDPPTSLAGTRAGVKVQSWINNPNKAYISGFEIDWQTNLWYLPSPFNNIVLNVNYTKIKSETDYPDSFVRSERISTFPFTQVVRVDTTRSGRILRQPDDILNIGFGYDYKGFSGRISFLFQGNILDELGSRSEEDSFTKDYFRMDISLRQKLPVEGLQVYANLNNINNRQDESYQSISGFFTQIERYGFTTDIGIRYQF